MIKIIISLLLLMAPITHASQFNTIEQEEQYDRITKQLRCLVCQNQTIADSEAELAEDLRFKVYKQVLQNKTDAEIIDYFVARYGDFIRYEPPFKINTLLLWFGPSLFLIIAIIVFIVIIRAKHKHLE